MKLRERLRRRLLLRRTPHLLASSPDGTFVQAIGRAYTFEDDEPFVPPVAGVPCVLAWSRIQTGASSNRNNRLTNIERLLVRTFELETELLSVVVDASHIDLLLPIYEQGRTQEKSVRDGQIVAVFGTVLRDGVEMPDGDIAFRDVTTTLRLVGNRRHPVVVTEP